MAKYTVEVQDSNGNIYNPHTSASVVFGADGKPISTIATLTHTRTATTHTLVGTMPSSGIVSATFKATADYTEGNTFSINGTAYTAKPNGEELTLPDKAFVLGDVVTVAVDVVGKKINFRVGGGSGFPKSWQQEVTAPATENIVKDDAVVYQEFGDVEEGMSYLNFSPYFVPTQYTTGDFLIISGDGNIAIIGFNVSKTFYCYKKNELKYELFSSLYMPSLFGDRISINYDGSLFVLQTNNSLSLYKLVNGTYSQQVSPTVPSGETFYSLQFSPSGKQFVCSCVGSNASNPRVLNYKVNDDGTLSLLQTLTGVSKGIVNFSRFSQDEGMLAIGGYPFDNVMHVLKIDQNKLLSLKQQIRCGEVTSSAGLTCGEFSPDLKYLILSGENMNQTSGVFYQNENGNYAIQPYTIPTSLKSKCGAFFSRDGKYLFAREKVYKVVSKNVFSEIINPYFSSLSIMSCTYDQTNEHVALLLNEPATPYRVYQIQQKKIIEKLVSVEMIARLSQNKLLHYGIGVALETKNKGQQCKVNLFPPINNNLGGVYE